MQNMGFQVWGQNGICSGSDRYQCGNFLDGVSQGLVSGGLSQVNIWQCDSAGCAGDCKIALKLQTQRCIRVSNSGHNFLMDRQPAYTTTSFYSCPVDSTCAHMMFFNRSAPGYVPGSCARVSETGYRGDFFDTACNACHYTPWGGIIRVDCDFVSQQIDIHHNCDATCSNCQHLGTIQHGLDNCSQAIFGGFDIINTGIYPCSVVTVKGFTDGNCNQLNHTLAFPQSRCSFGSIATCGAIQEQPTPTPPTTIAPSSNPDASGNNTANGGEPDKPNVAGIVVGVIVGVIVLVAAFFAYKKWGGSQQPTTTGYHEEPMNAQYHADPSYEMYKEGTQ